MTVWILAAWIVLFIAWGVINGDGMRRFARLLGELRGGGHMHRRDRSAHLDRRAPLAPPISVSESRLRT